jgi:pimeloyl-CoA synthetase
MKLALRLREYDWMAAVIELVIVVVGVLIALQVSNWNQDRMDHARADGYYRRLHAELMVDQHNIDNTLVFWKKVSDYGAAAIANGETGQRVDGSNWKTVLAWYQASQMMPFELQDTT